MRNWRVLASAVCILGAVFCLGWIASSQVGHAQGAVRQTGQVLCPGRHRNVVSEPQDANTVFGAVVPETRVGKRRQLPRLRQPRRGPRRENQLAEHSGIEPCCVQPTRAHRAVRARGRHPAAEDQLQHPPDVPARAELMASRSGRPPCRSAPREVRSE